MSLPYEGHGKINVWIKTWVQLFKKKIKPSSTPFGGGGLLKSKMWADWTGLC